MLVCKESVREATYQAKGDEFSCPSAEASCLSCHGWTNKKLTVDRTANPNTVSETGFRGTLTRLG